jgi:uncharacterized protein involved in exopolysaccharide biosynthesis
MTPQADAPPEYARNEITEEELNSEAELLRDEEMLRKVVQATGLAANDPWRFLPWREHDERIAVAHAIRRLAKHLNAEPMRKTNVIDVRYASSDPVLPARALNTLATVYVEKHSEVHRPSGEFHFFEQQAAEYGDRLRDAELRLMEFTHNEGVVAAALQRDIALEKLSEAEASYRQVRLDLTETGRRIRSLQVDLPSLPERTTTMIRTADNPQLMEKLKSRLLELELKHTELLTKYEPSYRLVQEVEQQIAEAKQAITLETATPVHEETTEKDPNFEWARTELEKAQVQLSGLRARATASEVQLGESRRLVRLLGEEAITQQDLLRNAKAAEESYLLYARKREEARIGDAMDSRGILNVMIAETPTVPALPKISALAFGILGMVAASVVSTGLAFAQDRLDPAFRTPDEVVAYLGTPVLAWLPKDAA